jgi:hypothetical protein
MLGECGTHYRKQAHHGRNGPSDVHESPTFLGITCSPKNCTKNNETKLAVSQAENA